MSEQKTILKVNNLSVDFPIFGGVFQRQISAVHAVKNLGFELFEGETLGIVGESGSGKSTLGKAILNVLKLTAPEVKITGEIFLNNQTELLGLSGKEMKNHRTDIQMIFQDPYSSLNPRMIVKDIIQEPLDIHTNMSTNEKKDKVDWLLNKVGLSTEQATRYPHEFSGGQRQRIGIARALYRDPEILILDEATSSLDNVTEKNILDSIQLLKKHKTLILITHRLSTVDRCDRVYFLNKGKIVKEGSSKEVLESI